MNYDRIASTAIKQIADKGRTVVLRTTTEGGYNPITDDYVGAGTSDKSVKAVFVNYKDTEIDKAIIQVGDKQCLIADLTVKPEVNDLIIDGTEQYKVINVNTVKPGNTAILYKLQVRR